MSIKDDPLFAGLFTDEVRTIRDLFSEAGFPLRLAGGAVRDILAKKVPKVRRWKPSFQ